MSTHYVPAIQAQMGDWEYYITKMKFGDVEKQVKLADQIHPNKDLDNLIQRGLTDRVKGMTDFLLNTEQRFYGSLVVAVYKGNPKFQPVKINEGHLIVDEVNHTFGLLQFDGSQTFFAIDGQHRLESIKAACEQNPDLRGEEISVIVLHHDGTAEGMIRTRRLFTKLNRYAKPTDNQTNIAIDEDDCVAIVTRRMIREYNKLSSLIKITSKKQIGVKAADNPFLTTMMAFYDFNFELLQAYDKDLPIDNKFRSKRPEDDLLDKMYNYTTTVWDALLEGISTLKKIISGQAVPGALRGGENGGSIWVRPNVQLIMAQVLKHAILDGKDLAVIIDALNRLPPVFNEEPWVRIIWNPSTQRVIGGKQEALFLVNLILHATGVAKPGMHIGEMKELYGKYHEKKTKSIPNYRQSEDLVIDELPIAPTQA